MNIIKKILLILFTIHSLNTFSSEIKISLFNDYSVKTLVFTCVEGNYKLLSGKDTLMTLKKNDLIYLSLVSNKISLRSIDKQIGNYTKLNLIPNSNNCVCRIKPILPSIKERNYDDKISFSIDYNRILIVNELDIDKYLAGVVEAEGGSNATLEYYKAQSLLCRTYATKNIDRHIEEGFNLCDDVHCQAFKGRSEKNPEILKATKATSGLVIIDKDSELITAAFHANCGGETQNSDNVWLNSKPYLKSVIDPFCSNKSNSKWEKKIVVLDWKNYLKKNGFTITNATNPESYTKKIKYRENYYTVGKDSISYNRIRKDWSLKSSFFSVVVEGNYVVLKGRGYGHGVGLCQIGAMEMSKKGYSYDEIINFYYFDVDIVKKKH